MISRYLVQKPLTKERLKNFVAIDNLSSQMPLIEIMHAKSGKRVRIWTAYNPERTFGTFTEVLTTGLVRTITIYPGGFTKEIINRTADTKDGKRKPNTTNRTRRSIRDRGSDKRP